MTDEGPLRLRDLGPVVVDSGGAERAPGGRVLERILARLLVDVNRRVDAAAVVEAVWGDRGAARSSSTLESHMWRLRQVLEPGRTRGAAAQVLLHEAGGYRLAMAADRIDSLRFARLVDEAADLVVGGRPDRAVRRAEQARALWRGRPYTPWSDEPWLAPTVARLEELHTQLGDTLVDALLGTGEPGRALVELVFREELGVDPGARLRRLHARILADGVPAAPAPPPPVASRAPEVHLPHRRGRLIGRDDELRDLARRLVHRPLVTATTAELLARAVERLNRPAYEQAWREGSTLGLADLAEPADAHG